MGLQSFFSTLPNPSEAAAIMANSPACRYRSASRLAFCATLLFVALTVTNALAALSLVGQIQLLDAARFGVSLPSAQAEAQDARQRLFGILEISINLAAVVSLFVWTYRANRNARALGAEGMEYTPGWSVGWFFVPLANLFMPYRVFKELWKASSLGERAQWRQAAVPAVLGAWWAIWLVRGVIHYSPWPIITGKMRLAQLSEFGFASSLWADSLWEHSWGLLVADVVDIAANVLTIVVVLGITTLQENRRELLIGPAESTG